MKKTFDDSLADFIMVLTEEALLSIENEEEARRVVATTVSELLSSLVPVSESWH